MWEHFRHQADIGIRGIGTTLQEAFKEAAVSLMEVICNPAQVAPKETVQIRCQADEKDLLFADWINALIYEMDVRKMLFSAFEVHIQNDQLSAAAIGEPIDPDRHDISVGVKAATFMELKVYENDQHQWIAQCVVDV